MPRFDLITALPESVDSYLAHGVLGRAVEDGKIEVGVHSLREFGRGKHRQVDDYPYGGGQGMVLQAEPVVASIEKVKAGGRVLLLSPAGRRFDQVMARELAAEEQVVLVCGRYEGVDERVMDWVDEAVSLGDFVLTGGELGALVIIDAVARLQPGVLGNDASAGDGSFEGPLLECPQYTRPRSFRERDVPAVLLSGDHAKIGAWRQDQAARRTHALRPDLVADRDSLPRDLRDLLEALDDEVQRE